MSDQDTAQVEGQSEGEATEQAPSAPAHVVKTLEEFLAAHGGSGTAVLQPVGRAGVRVTVVAEDGTLGDQLVRTMDEARAVVDATANLGSESEWTRELVSTANPAPGHWKKMAGWVANT